MTDFANLGIKVQTGQLRQGGKALDDLGRKAGVTERRLSTFTSRTARRFGNLQTAITGTLAAFGVATVSRSIIAIGSRFEDVRSILHQVTGSTRAATGEFERLMLLGRNSSVETMKIAELQASLLANQISLTTDEWLSLIEAAENTLVPRETLTNLAVFRQRLDQGAVSLMDLDRVADRGLPVYRILEEQLGKTRLELNEFSKTAGGTAKVWEALVEGLDNAFGGSAARRANNMSRLLNNLGDTFQELADGVFQGVSPAVKLMIRDITGLVETLTPALTAVTKVAGALLTFTWTALSVPFKIASAIADLAADMLSIEVSSRRLTQIANRLPASNEPGTFAGPFATHTPGAAHGGTLRLPRHRGRSRSDLVEAMRRADIQAVNAPADGGATDRAFPDQGSALDQELQRYRELQREMRSFRRSVDFEFSHAINELVRGTDEGAQAVKDMIYNLGNELEARVLDHAIGKPFRDLMSTLLEQIYDALTSRTPWGANGNLFSWLASGGAGAGRVAGVGPLAGSIPSLHGGGFTGRGMRAGGIDGRGGFPAILHPNETVVDHKRGGAAVAPINVVVNNNAPEVAVSATPTNNGVELEILSDKQVANALARGRETGRAMRGIYGNDRIPGA